MTTPEPLCFECNHGRHNSVYCGRNRQPGNDVIPCGCNHARGIVVTSKPSLELSEEEWKEIRLELASVRVCREDRGGESPCAACENYERAVNFLLRVEAGRQQADWERQAARQGQDCNKLPEGNWTPADWLNAVKKDAGYKRGCIEEITMTLLSVAREMADIQAKAILSVTEELAGIQDWNEWIKLKKELAQTRADLERAQQENAQIRAWLK